MSTSCHTSLKNTPKMLKNHPQNRPKIDQKINKKSIQQPIRKTITSWIDLGLIFGRFLVDFGAPRGAPEITFRALLGSWGHLGAKMAPRALQEAPRQPPRQILDQF